MMICDLEAHYIFPAATRSVEWDTQKGNIEMRVNFFNHERILMINDSATWFYFIIFEQNYEVKAATG